MERGSGRALCFLFAAAAAARPPSRREKESRVRPTEKQRKRRAPLFMLSWVAEQEDGEGGREGRDEKKLQKGKVFGIWQKLCLFGASSR